VLGRWIDPPQSIERAIAEAIAGPKTHRGDPSRLAGGPARGLIYGVAPAGIPWFVDFAVTVNS
jgi:hypothetical protein